jgi:poly-beta-hydroxybutyrate-responsive repressor
MTSEEPEGRECGKGCRCQCQVRGYIQPRLLLLLAQASAHGYELMEELRSVPDEENLSDPGLIYRTLRQLEVEGFLTSSWDTEVRGPARRVYQITSAGREYLDLWAANIRSTRERLAQFLTEYDSLGAAPSPPAPSRKRRKPNGPQG